MRASSHSTFVAGNVNDKNTLREIAWDFAAYCTLIESRQRVCDMFSVPFTYLITIKYSISVASQPEIHSVAFSFFENNHASAR